VNTETRLRYLLNNLFLVYCVLKSAPFGTVSVIFLNGLLDMLIGSPLCTNLADVSAAVWFPSWPVYVLVEYKFTGEESERLSLCY
jgi:hypothetical protein